MRPRASLIDIFSTFLQFDADRLKGWICDRTLQRNMERTLKTLTSTAASESFWVLYWHKLWQQQPQTLAYRHLVAYLQEAGYWASQKIFTNFANPQYALSDYFQISMAQVEKVLKGFKPQQGVSLQRYASAVFYSAIKETLRQRQEVDICTPWALLRKLSQKRLEESLRLAGLSEVAIAASVLAWNCFKTLYAPTQATGTRQLDSPDAETWQAIAILYNQERQNLPPASPDTLEQWLLTCVKYARSYLYPTCHSLNALKPEQDQEWLDELQANEHDSLLNELIVAEETQTQFSQQTQINQVLTQALQNLDASAQLLLKLYYAGGLTQHQLAQQLEIKQYTVSRRLTKIRSELLLVLSRWSQDTLHISLSSDVLKTMSVVLEEWLNAYYSP